MAKTAKPKHDSRLNPRSRASRRATSPSLNMDKSLQDTPRASDATPVLKPFQNSGVQKKTKKKHLTHAQRLRHERGLAKAEAVQDRTELKVQDAKSRLRRRQSRRALWDEVNEDTKEESRKAIKAPGRNMEASDDDDMKDDIQPFHGDTEIKVVDGVLVPSFATGQAMNLAVAATAPPTFVSTKKPGSFGVSKPVPPEENAKTVPVDEIT